MRDATPEEQVELEMIVRRLMRGTLREALLALIRERDQARFDANVFKLRAARLGEEARK